MKPKIIFIRGLPGSGKSVLAQAMIEKIGPEHTVVLDPDAIDENSEAYQKLTAELRKQGVDEKFYPYRYLRNKAHQAIRSGITVLWNQAFTNLDGLQKTINNLTDYASEQGKAPEVVVVEVFIDPATAAERIETRVKSGGHQVDEKTFARFVHDFKSFVDEPFKTITVNGEMPAEENAEQIVSQLS